MDSDLYSRAVVATIHSITKLRNWFNTPPGSTSTSIQETNKQCQCCAIYNYVSPWLNRRPMGNENDAQDTCFSTHSFLETGGSRDREFEESTENLPKRLSLTSSRKFSQIGQIEFKKGVDGADLHSSVKTERSRSIINKNGTVKTTSDVSSQTGVQTSKVFDQDIRKTSIISIASVKFKRAINDHKNSICSKKSSFCIEGERQSFGEIVEKRSFGLHTVFGCLQIMEEQPESARLKTLPKKLPSRGEITGHMKLCAQYFGNSKVLRVIVRRASHLRARKGHVLGKLDSMFLYSTDKGQKFQLRKVDAASDVMFNEDFYFDDIDEEKVDQLVLKVRLYNKERLLSSKKLLGEMVIPVYKYDVSMDTNIKGHLRQKKAEFKSLEDYDSDSDIEVRSEDRSIAASVAASLSSSPYPRDNMYNASTTLKTGIIDQEHQFQKVLEKAGKFI